MTILPPFTSDGLLPPGDYELSFDKIKQSLLGGEVSSLTVQVKNTRAIPSIAQQAALNRVGLPDVLSLEGEGLTVVGGGSLVNSAKHRRCSSRR